MPGSIRPRGWNMFDVGLHTTSYRVLSLPEARMRIRKLRREVRKQSWEQLDKGAALLEEAWKRNVQERAYRTGNYYDSIRREVTGDMEVHVGTDARNPQDGAPYPQYLEFGTSRMAARPTWKPAIDEVGDEAGNLIMAGYFALFEEIL